MENCDPPTPWHRLAHFCYAKHPPFPSSPLHNPPAPPPPGPLKTRRSPSPLEGPNGAFGGLGRGGGGVGAVPDTPRHNPRRSAGGPLGAMAPFGSGGGGGASPNPPPGPHDRRSHRAPSGPWPCRGRSGASTMVKGGGGLGGPVSTPPPPQVGGGAPARGRRGSGLGGGGCWAAMHWKGGTYPLPPLPQYAQPMPSHCLPDGKCKAQLWPTVTAPNRFGNPLQPPA